MITGNTTRRKDVPSIHAALPVDNARRFAQYVPNANPLLSFFIGLIPLRVCVRSCELERTNTRAHEPCMSSGYHVEGDVSAARRRVIRESVFNIVAFSSFSVFSFQVQTSQLLSESTLSDSIRESVKREVLTHPRR